MKSGPQDQPKLPPKPARNRPKTQKTKVPHNRSLRGPQGFATRQGYTDTTHPPKRRMAFRITFFDRVRT